MLTCNVLDETEAKAASRDLPIERAAAAVERLEKMSAVVFCYARTAVGHLYGDPVAPRLDRHGDRVV